MQGAAAEPGGGRRPAQQQFAGVDLRRPKGYAAPAAAQRAAPAEGDPCPRCESRDTKFCYYNNYNTSQPRHFCKGCRRYWTKGGTLRNVPVGGGTRKKPSSSPPSSYAAAANADKPRKPYKKKRRVVAPSEPVAATATTTTVVVAAPPADSAKITTTNETTKTTTTNETARTTTTNETTMTDAASEITTDLVVPAAEEEDSLAHLLQPDVALGLGISDFPATGKALDLEPDSFEWPASFDLGAACWDSARFADLDPAGLFLNLP